MSDPTFESEKTHVDPELDTKATGISRAQKQRRHYLRTRIKEVRDELKTLQDELKGLKDD